MKGINSSILNYSTTFTTIDNNSPYKIINLNITCGFILFLNMFHQEPSPKHISFIVIYRINSQGALKKIKH